MIIKCNIKHIEPLTDQIRGYAEYHVISLVQTGAKIALTFHTKPRINMIFKIIVISFLFNLL